MNKLQIPKNCTIRGSLESIVNDGDIGLEGGLLPNELTSTHGDINVQVENQDIAFEDIKALEGHCHIESGACEIDRLAAKGARLETGNTRLDQAAVDEVLFMKTADLQFDQLSAGDINIEAGDAEGVILKAEGTLSLNGNKLKFQEIVANRVIINGQLSCQKLTATESVTAESGSVKIKFLDAPNFQSNPTVRGIVMVSTAEKVKAEGIRGFLHPDELDFLSDATQDDRVQHASAINTQDLAKLVDERKREDTPPEPVTPAYEPPVSEPETDLSEPALAEGEPLTESEPEAYTPPQDDGIGEDILALSPEDEPLPEDDEILEPEAGSFDEEPFAEALTEDDMLLEADEAEPLPDPDETTNPSGFSLVDLPTPGASDGLDTETDNAATRAINPGQLEHMLHSRSDSLAGIPDEVVPIPGSTLAQELGGPDPLDDSIMDMATLGEELPEGEPLEAVAVETPDVPEMALTDSPAEEELPSVSSFEDYSARFENPLGEEDELDAPSPDDFAEDVGDPSEEMGEFISRSLEVDEPPSLEERLTEVLNQIRAEFPDENYPKFITQIQNYVNEGRFNILLKERNMQAVLGSFDKLQSDGISQKARSFYRILQEEFQ